MNSINIFPVTVWHEKISIPDVILSQIKKFCYERKEQDFGRRLSNVGGWQSNSLFSDDLHTNGLSELCNLFELKLNFCYQQLTSDFSDEKKLTLGNIWINVNNKNNYNNPHTHPSSVLSGVFYLTDGSGLVLQRSEDLMSFFLENIAESNFRTELTSREITFNPSVGSLVVFPSWLRHRVLPNNCDQERISIAFNSYIKYNIY